MVITMQSSLAATRLARFLSKHGISQDTVAQAVGTSQGQVSRWLHKGVVPDTPFQLALEAFTGGYVEPSHWLTVEQRKRLRAVQTFAADTEAA